MFARSVVSPFSASLSKSYPFALTIRTATTMSPHGRRWKGR